MGRVKEMFIAMQEAEAMEKLKEDDQQYQQWLNQRPEDKQQSVNEQSNTKWKQ